MGIMFAHILRNEESSLTASSRFVGNPKGVSNVFLTYFDYFFEVGGQYKLGGLGCTREGGKTLAPTNRARLTAS